MGDVRWVPIPLPDGATDEVYAAVTEALTEDEKRALGEYMAWWRRRHPVDRCPTCGGTREQPCQVERQAPPGIGNWHGPPGHQCFDSFHEEGDRP